MKTNIEAIKLANLTYISDVEWAYSYEDQFKCIDFYKDKTGRNNIEQFLFKKKNVWFPILPTEEEIKLMYSILNETPYREVEPDVEEISDYYDYYGVDPKDFY
jgi:hypothetical protein